MERAENLIVGMFGWTFCERTFILPVLFELMQAAADYFE